MVSFSTLAPCVSVLLSFSAVWATPVNITAYEGLSSEARDILARATPSAPHWVIYSDEYTSGLTGPPAPSAVSGFNVFALSFLLTEGAWDKAEEWTQLNASQRSTIKSQYAAAGIKLIVSAFGSSDAPTTSNPVSTANTMANWVIQYDLDGIDVDYEDFNAMDAGDGKAEAWLVSFTQQLRANLPQGSYILTHAPVAPWFSPNKWGGGGYLKVHSQVGSLIDWYNVQFYNRKPPVPRSLLMPTFNPEGTSEYTTCSGLLTSSSSTWPQSALFQIAASGVPLSKLVIGKPANSGDASSGFMSASTLATCVQTAKAQGWNAGVMVWEYPAAASSWISTVRSLAWPV